MINFFKNFGKGILYVLVLPFLLVGMAIYGVIALFVFIFLCIKGLVLFFTGRSLYEDLPEDIEAKKRLAAFANPNPQPQGENTSGTTIINTTPIIDGNNQSSDPFYVPEYLKDEDTVEEVEEPIEEEETLIEEQPTEQVVEEQKKIETTEEDVISVEKTPQNTTIYEVDDSDDDDDDSGVNIDFD